jgi:ribonuclease VapC
MIVDTSALVAVVRGEPERQRFLEIMNDAPRLAISAANLVEVGIVVDSIRSPEQSNRLDATLGTLGFNVEPVTEPQARIARQAYRDFGRRSGHPEKLNYGDCFAYALAKDLGEALLFKGDDFGHTDVRRVVPET